MIRCVPTVLLVLLLASASPGGEEEPIPLKELQLRLASGNYQVRRKAVLAVEGRTEPELLDRVLAMAKADPHPNIRGYCADVLGTFRDARIFPVLAGMVHGKSPGPRRSAYVALGRLRDPRAFEILKAGLVDVNVRAYAARGLGWLGDPRSFDLVANLYAAHRNDPYVMDLAPESLLRLDRGRALDLLLPAFRKMEPAPRTTLVRHLRKNQDVRIRVFMTGLLAEEDDHLRRDAIRTLGSCGDAATARRLIPLLEGPDRLVAAKSLREIGDAAAARPVARALRKETDAVTRVVFIRTLARLGDRRAVAGMVPLLDDLSNTRQPGRISAIWGYPHNVHVQAAAIWAIRTLIDGEPPIPADKLIQFPIQPGDEWAGREIAKFREWWKAHGDERAWRYAD